VVGNGVGVGSGGLAGGELDELLADGDGLAVGIGEVASLVPGDGLDPGIAFGAATAIGPLGEVSSGSNANVLAPAATAKARTRSGRRTACMIAAPYLGPCPGTIDR